MKLPNVGNTYGGIPISQTWNDLALWELFFNHHPCGSIIELGTWQGGMALYLALKARSREMQFVSIDHHDQVGNGRHAIVDLGAKLLTLDLLASEAVEEMRKLIGSLPKPLALFCDNGNKPQEFRLFVPLLSSGDRVIVHDWGTEFTQADVDPPIPMILQAECESIDSMTRFFLVP